MHAPVERTLPTAETTPPLVQPASRPLRAWRLLRLAWVLLWGGLTALLVFPFTSPRGRQRLRQRWSVSLLHSVGVRLRHRGHSPEAGCMLVANHISWLDIFVINALTPAAFVSKAEVRQWPLIGWLAARNDTVFLMRGSRGHARIVNGRIAALLDAGTHVAVFPEGTTTDGSQVLHFHAALLQPAIACGHPVQPLALRYHDASGLRSQAPAYVGDTSLLASLLTIVSARGLVADCTVHAPLPTGNGTHRRDLATQARDAIIQSVTAQAPDCRTGQESHS